LFLIQNVLSRGRQHSSRNLRFGFLGRTLSASPALDITNLSPEQTAVRSARFRRPNNLIGTRLFVPHRCGSHPSNSFISRGTVVARLADGLLDGTTRRGQLGSRQHHRLVGSAAERDGLEDLPFARTIGNASHLAPGLRGRAGDKLRDQASSVAVWHGSLSKRHLDILKKLPNLRLWKTNDQPGEAWQ
jgi:hypothetical protein